MDLTHRKNVQIRYPVMTDLYTCIILSIIMAAAGCMLYNGKLAIVIIIFRSVQMYSMNWHDGSVDIAWKIFKHNGLEVCMDVLHTHVANPSMSKRYSNDSAKELTYL